jgi:hypothetical protein
MAEHFRGKWRGTVIGRTASYAQRVLVTGASSGNGAYNGVVGTSFVFEDGDVELQWNNNSGSGWQPSATVSSVGMSSPLVVVRFISADDNYPNKRDGDYNDLKVKFEHLDPPFRVLERPFAVDRGALVMMPDGIFETSQGVQYMGVRISNDWLFDWQSDFPPTGMKIGIAPASRIALAASGVQVLDSWSTQEQQAFGQVVDAGYVRVPDLRINEAITIYFKVDVSAAPPSKPEVGFVAQRDAFDTAFDAPSRVVQKKIFISRSSYDKNTKELVAALPEGTLRLKMDSIKLDRKGANDAAKVLMRCLQKQPGGGASDPGGGRGSAGGSWWEDCVDERACRERARATLRDLLRDVEAGKPVDVCALKDLMDRCCHKDHRSGSGCGCVGGGKKDDSTGGYPGGGWQEGTGVDGWCRVRPVAWLPVSFEYKLEPNPAYMGQFGPLAFEDPWWKVVLLILALLLYVASLIYDYVNAGQDPRFIIGKIARNGDANTNLVDCAVSDLNGSRGVNLGELDAQGDDVNNGSPIEGLGNIIQLDRTDNGSFGVQAATLGNTVWKSGGRSGTTRGVVTAINLSTSVPYDTEDTISGTINYVNQVLVTQIAGMEQPLSQGGDSGSVWVDLASHRPVALNFAGPTSDDGTQGIGNPILQVINQLNLRFNG